MPTGPTRFRLNDVVRAKKAAIKAGLVIAAIEIDSNGTIRIVPKDNQEPEQNEWDAVETA